MRPIVTNRVAWSVGLSHYGSVQKHLNRSRLLFWLWAQMGPRNRVRWGPQVLRDVAMATNFWLSMGYNFGCIIASDTLFILGVGFRGLAIR